MKRNYYLFLLAILLGLFLGACQKQTGLDGSAKLSDFYGSYQVVTKLNSDKTTVNFDKDELLTISAKYSIAIDWILQISAKDTSNSTVLLFANKKVSTYKDTLTSTYTVYGKGKDVNVVWDGTSDNANTFNVFGKGIVTIKLVAKGTTDTMFKTVTLLSPKKITGNCIVNDFSTPLSPLWPQMTQSGADYKYSVIKSDTMVAHLYNSTTKKTDTLYRCLTSPYNNHNFLYIKGAVNWDWGVAGLEMPAQFMNYPAVNNVKQYYFPNISSNPKNVYLNLLIYSDVLFSQNNEASLLVNINEDDNGDHKWNALNDDQYAYSIKLNWTGWKMISINYDTLKNASNVNAGITFGMSNKGNGIQDPCRIYSVGLILLANPAKGIARVGVSDVVFTNYKPLKY